MRERVRRLLMYVGILAGDCMVIGMFVVLSIQPPALATSYVSKSERAAPMLIPAIVGEPTNLAMDRLQLGWPVMRGAFDPNTSTWTDSGDQVIFAEGSVPPNDSNGTTLLYGHARSSVFSNLSVLQPGDIATIETANGHVFMYRFESMEEVVPTDVSVLTEAGPPRLVLQTCSGPLDSYRALYYFQFVEVT
jgi:LPXTG-site transpeptidase (sortase) family protein